MKNMYTFLFIYKYASGFKHTLLRHKLWWKVFAHYIYITPYTNKYKNVPNMFY